MKIFRFPSGIFKCYLFQFHHLFEICELNTAYFLGSTKNFPLLTIQYLPKFLDVM